MNQPRRPSPPLGNVTRALLVVAGLLSLGLGILGIVLPILPTTPFLLLAAACFLRSSRRLYAWITGNRFFGPPIRAYLRYRAIGRGTKIAALVTLWVVIGATIVFVLRNPWLRIGLAAIASGVSVHILMMKTITPEIKAAILAETEGEKGTPGMPDNRRDIEGSNH